MFLHSQLGTMSSHPFSQEVAAEIYVPCGVMPESWEAPPTNSVTFSVPDDWKSGRIWVFVVHPIRGLPLHSQALRRVVEAAIFRQILVPILALMVDAMEVLNALRQLGL